jgi:hypothetical protein
MYIPYLILNRPFKDQSDHHLELFTEGCILMFIYTFLCFTDFILEPETRYNVGWVAIIIFMINLLGNLVVVIRGSISSAKQTFK